MAHIIRLKGPCNPKVVSIRHQHLVQFQFLYMLKGWLDRVWLPGVAFTVAKAKQRRIGGELSNIRLFVGITTSGSPWWWLKLIGDPGRSLLMKGLRPLYARGCRRRWLQLHNMNHVTAPEREAFLARVERELRALR